MSNGNCQSPQNPELAYTGDEDTVRTMVDSSIEENRPFDGHVVQIENVGPISRLTMPIPLHGGVVVLKGANGSGKSHALNATQALVTGKGSLSVRDRELKGSVDGFGAHITVGRSTRRSGELEVKNLEGRLNIFDLVDPGLKDENAADGKRIRALCQLTGAKADHQLFRDVLGDNDLFDNAVSISSLGTLDIVDMAAGIKRDYEKSARRYEDAEEKNKARAQGMKQSIEGIDLTAECDPDVLQTRMNEAVKAEAELKAQCEAAEKQAESIAHAQKCIEAAKTRFTGPTVEETQAKKVALETEVRSIGDEIASLESQLINLRQAKSEMELRLNAATAALQQAEEHAKTVADWEARIQASTIIAPTTEALEAAKVAVTTARQNIELGAKVRSAKETAAYIEGFMIEAQTCHQAAERLRDAAKLTDDVLSKAVASVGVLRIEGGRLVLDTERGATYFHDLSDGERWKIAICIAAKSVGEGGVLVIDQVGWEGIDPNNRLLVDQYAKEYGVTILTAEADVGELRAEQFTTETEAA